MDSLAAEMPIEDWLTRKDIEKKKAELEAGIRQSKRAYIVRTLCHHV